MLEERWQGLLERAAKWAPLAAAVAAAFYAVGFVIVTAYLASYGVRELDPLRPRYVAAAMPFLAAVTSTWLTARGARALSAAAAPGRRIERFLLDLVTYTVAAFVAAWTIWFVMLYATPGWVADFGAARENFGKVFRFCSTIVVALWLFRAARGQGPFAVLREPYWAVIFGLGAIAAYLPLYGALPTWVGGGRPDPVRLTLSSPIAGCDGCERETMRLLDADAERVVVLQGIGPQERAIEIARTQVLIIQHTAKSER